MKYSFEIPPAPIPESDIREVIETDMAVLASGVRANIDLAKNAGVEVGKIEKIDLENQRALVTLKMNKGVEVRRDARALQGQENSLFLLRCNTAEQIDRSRARAQRLLGQVN